MPAVETSAFEKSQTLTPQLLDHIEHVVWGFETGVRYRILERQAELERVLPHGHLLTLWQDKQLLGTLLCLEKAVTAGRGSSVNALYLTTLSVLPAAHGQGLAKRLLREATTNAGKSRFEYAYIEENNIPSAAVFKSQGFEAVGQFHAMTLNRLRPLLSFRPKRLDVRQVEELKASLSNLYRDHSLADFETSLLPEQYWVITDKGRIVAGAQIEEEVWSIVSMPGPDGWFAANLLPRLPLLRRILNPQRIPVLKIGNLFVPEGHETDFMELIEHLTHAFGKKAALAYLDKKSPVTQRLMSKLRFGILNAFFETPVNIWARFPGTDENDWAALKKGPFVISPHDIS